MNRSLYKKRYDPDMGMYVKKHIYGEGIGDILKTIGSKIFNKTTKELASKTGKKLAETALTKGSEKVGSYVGEKGGEKIVQLLSKRNKEPAIGLMTETKSIDPRQLSQYEINDRANNILSGGKLRRKVKFM